MSHSGQSQPRGASRQGDRSPARMGPFLGSFSYVTANNFEREFPFLQIRLIRPCLSFRYLVSGSVSLRTLMPELTYPVWQTLENFLDRWPRTWPMFAFINIERT